MKTYLVCFEVTGGLSVEAESEDEVMEYIRSVSCQEEIGMILAQNDVTITEISICKEDL